MTTSLKLCVCVCVSSKAANGKMLLYESFAQATALGDLHTCLMMDMKACQEDDIRLLCYLTPSIYSQVHTHVGRFSLAH